MFRDAIRKLSLRQKLTILASVGVLLPVLILSYLQYRSLTALQNSTKGAFKDGLRQGLTILEGQLKQRLENIAAQTLGPTDNLQTSEEFERYFTEVKRSHREIEEIFAYGYSSDQQQPPVLPLFEQARMAQSSIDTNHNYLFLYHSCRTCASNTRQGTYLFHELKKGFAGVLLKEDFVRNDLMGRTIDGILNQRSHNSGTTAMTIAISDENNQVLYSHGPPQGGYSLESTMDRPFSNWKAAMGLKNTSLDDFVHDIFLHSVGATILVLLFLLGGIALTLRATDREARLAQAKSNFVSNVSHELKTPLSLISLFSEILELGRVNSEEKKMEYYRIIHHESQRLNKMIDNILDFSKIEAGKKKYAFAECNIAEVIEGVLSNYRYQIINSGFQLQTDIQPHLPAMSIDRDAMTQAISNLLDNAIKYSGDVKELSIKAEMRGSELAIEVGDQGIGIPRAEQEKVFQKFYRVGDGLVHDVKGSGLGLSLVRHIVAAHKGTVSVESEVGKGSRFTIHLPLTS